MPPEFTVTSPVKDLAPVEEEMVRVPVTEVAPPTESALAPVSKLPAVIVSAPGMVTPAPRVHPPPEPLKVNVSKLLLPGFTVKPVVVPVKVVTCPPPYENVPELVKSPPIERALVPIARVAPD